MTPYPEQQGVSAPERILVIEDDKAIRALVTAALESRAMACITAGTGREAIAEASRAGPDVILLDLGLPDMDGTDIIRTVRQWSMVPIIVLSARSEDDDKVAALDAGADDYLTKPFSIDELLARLRIWSRRTVSLEDPGELCFGDLSYRPSVRQLSGPAGKEVLPKRLAQLIELLLRNAEVPITRNVIFNRIWGPDAEVTDAVIDTYIHLTRQRLAHLQSAVKIQNSRGPGYQLSYEREL